MLFSVAVGLFRTHKHETDTTSLLFLKSVNHRLPETGEIPSIFLLFILALPKHVSLLETRYACIMHGLGRPGTILGVVKLQHGHHFWKAGS